MSLERKALKLDKKGMLEISLNTNTGTHHMRGIF